MTREYQHSEGDDYLTELIHTANQTAEVDGAGVRIPYRRLHVSTTDGDIANDGTDTETVSVEVKDGLEVAKGTGPATATVLDYTGDVTLTIDGKETTKTLSSGSVSFDVTTEKPTGSSIEVVAESLADHPAESDSATIEVTT